MTRHFSRRDLLAGGVFVAFGLAFALGARTYEVGSALQMGPGYFPLVLGGLLVLLGLVIVAQGLVAGGDEPTAPADEQHAAHVEQVGPIPWLKTALLVAAIIVFGLGVRELGLVPSLLVTTFLAASAGYRTSFAAAAVIAVGLTIACILIFVVLLRIRLPLFGSWLPV